MRELYRLLRVRRERPRNRGTAESTEKFPPPHVDL